MKDDLTAEIPSIRKVSFVLSVYNEEQMLEKFWPELKICLDQLSMDKEVVFVNDGSTDQSLAILNKIAENNRYIKILSLSRNFGHEAAMIAGIDNSSGDVVIVMDVDLQHPFESINNMLEQYLAGYEIVTMVRKENEESGFIRKKLSGIFYRMLHILSGRSLEPNVSDFFLISGRIADILRSGYRERVRFLRGYIQLMGFRKISLSYSARKRAGGKSKYSFPKLITLSVAAISNFSNLPLYLGIIGGLIMASLSLIVTVYSVIMKLSGFVIPGYTTLVVLISFLFSVQLFVVGIIGQYIAFLFEESKGRPIYIIDKIIKNGQDQ